MSEEGLGFGRKALIEKIVKANWKINHPERKNFTYTELLFVIQEMLDEEGKHYYNKKSAMRGHHIFREFVKLLLYRNLANYDSMVLLTGDKGCLTVDTLIDMPRDLIKYPKGIPIKDLIDKGPIHVYSFNKDTKKIELKKSDGVEFVKRADVYEIETVNGMKIKATDDHPFMLMDGTFKKLKDIKLEDKLQLKNNITQLINKKYIGKINVYDIVNVRDNHNFIANNFVVSNSGKSSCAIMMAREWLSMQGKTFNPKKHIAYNNAEIMTKIDNLSPFEVIICDEAVRFCCLHGDTIIDLPEGKFKIKYLEGRKNFDVVSYNEKTKEREIKKAKSCIKVREDIVYEIKTEDGKKIRATKEHKFLTSNGWKKLEELNNGDDLIGSYLILKIKSITKKEIVPVYDIIDVEDNNNFIANDLVTHNSSEDWNKKESKALKKKLAEVRTKHLLFILCFPLKIQKVDKTYLDAFTNYWCLTGDTKITIKDASGMVRNVPMKKFNHYKNKKILSYNKDIDDFEFKECGKCVKTKKDTEVFEVELENGMKVKATEDHLFLTKDGYKKLKDLIEDDEIIIRDRECNHCGDNFIPKRESMKSCSVRCNKLSRTTPEERSQYLKEYQIKNKDRIKKQKKNKYLENREYILEKAKKYRQENRDRINAWAKKYRQENVELLRERDKKYRDNNYEKQRRLKRNNFNRYMRENPNFKIGITLRNQLRQALKNNSVKKTISVIKLLGCSIQEFKEYISKKFTEGMSWDNHGEWHLDHIRPIASFDNLEDIKQQEKCFHYTNFQPLWASENIRKGAKYDSD